MPAVPRTILVATDNSKQSVIAVDWAVALAKSIGAALHVVRVGMLSPWLYPVRLSDRQVKTLEGEAQAALDEAIAQVESSGGTVAGAHLKMGGPTARSSRLVRNLAPS